MQARNPFTSALPRPYSRPLRSAGSTASFHAGSNGTVSVWHTSVSSTAFARPPLVIATRLIFSVPAASRCGYWRRVQSRAPRYPRARSIIGRLLIADTDGIATNLRRISAARLTSTVSSARRRTPVQSLPAIDAGRPRSPRGPPRRTPRSKDNVRQQRRLSRARDRKVIQIDGKKICRPIDVQASTWNAEAVRTRFGRAGK